MIFAAGFGTRMGALTADRPKPLVEVGGQTLLDRALGLARDEGLGRIVVNTHYRGDQIARHLQGSGVAISDEADAILETGGGLRQALPLLGADTVMTLNPDVVWHGPNPLSMLRAAWDPVRMDALLLCVDPKAAVGRLGAGDFDPDAEGRLTRGGQVIYGGAQVIATDDLSAIPDPAFSLNRVWDLMIARGRLFGLTYPGQWCDVGRPEGIGMAEGMLGADHV
ncbi:nucleotidyltransferase family protein [Oceanicola sp. 22II-s10i]|uniref:nucleotidyltransferase family protein n=1 Tax=Oceanicola sp. 22II-s10i TaxID=1317116 RepID=UPI0020CD61BE|nr:nucleotidyltransferase family protein [Oceanicola sp. 22II-s10i]